MDIIENSVVDTSHFLKSNADNVIFNTKKPVNRVYSDLECTHTINEGNEDLSHKYERQEVLLSPQKNIQNRNKNDFINYTYEHNIIRRNSDLKQRNDLIATVTDMPCQSCSNWETESLNNNRPICTKKLCGYESNYDLLNKTSSKIDDIKSKDKATYCFPSTNIYDPEFVYKTIRSNVRLQNLLHKLVLDRRRDKQEIWNNYINELKNKHTQSFQKSAKSSGGQQNPEIISDYCNLSFNLKQTYPHHGPSQSNVYNDIHLHNCNTDSQLNPIPYFYENDPYCYPISSQGRFMMLNKARQMNQYGMDWHPRPSERYYRSGVIVADREKRSLGKLHPCRKKTKLPFKIDKSAQTSFNTLFCDAKTCDELKKTNIINSNIRIPTNDNQTKQKKTLKVEHRKLSKNVEELKMKVKESDEQQQKYQDKSLSNIEGKLDTLIQSINQFLGEFKTKSVSKSTSMITCECIDNGIQLSETKLESDSSIETSERDKQVFYSVVQGGTRSAFTLSDIGNNRSRENSSSKIDKILIEEIDKSNKIKRDIESLLKLRNDVPCAVRISFDIPTRDICTEVTSSLSKTGLSKARIAEIGCSSDTKSERRMTMAVNTDPLGLLALLRMSTETVKQIISYMPQIDYYSYLPMLQFPQIPRNCVSHYICNICGAAFGRPSQLSDHIQKHDLGNTRDCCICRHILDRKHRRLYCCEYCGQRFTRAYCCELHRQSCARRLGRIHDIASSHIILK